MNPYKWLIVLYIYLIVAFEVEVYWQLGYTIWTLDVLYWPALLCWLLGLIGYVLQKYVLEEYILWLRWRQFIRGCGKDGYHADP